MSNTKIKTGNRLLVTQILVGLLALAVGIISLAPIKFLGFPIGLQVTILSYVIFGVVLIAVAGFRLANAFSLETSRLAKQIDVATSIIIIIPTILILYLQLISYEQLWFHYLFGIGLLSYAIGRIAIGLLERENKLERFFTLGLGSAIGVLAVIVLLLRFIPISQTSAMVISNGNTTITVPSGVHVTALSSGYLVIIALILIGINLLLPSILTVLLRRQKY
jgi:hypothetical protein